MVEEKLIETIKLDDIAKEEVIKAIEKSFNGESITDYQATILFYWARHQDDKAFSFVPKQYRLNAASKKAIKGKVSERK